VDAAVGAGLLRASDDVYRTLSLTPPGREVMAGRSTEAELTLPEPRGRASRAARQKRALAAVRDAGSGTAAVLASDAPEETDHILLAELKAWRRREAADRSVPPYVVFHDRTLALIAALKPRSLDALAQVPGIGPAKLAAYGPALLALIAPG
jgi:ATP-dependent DNA helicase RecQ